MDAACHMAITSGMRGPVCRGAEGRGRGGICSGREGGEGAAGGSDCSGGIESTTHLNPGSSQARPCKANVDSGNAVKEEEKQGGKQGCKGAESVRGQMLRDSK